MSEFNTLYKDDMSLWDKTKYVAQNIYGAQDIIADKKGLEISLRS